VDADIGGTFTDATVSPSKVAKIFKVVYHSPQLSQCLHDVLLKATRKFALPGTKTFLGPTHVIRVCNHH